MILLSGCIGGGGETPPATGDLGRRIVAGDFESRWLAARELMLRGPGAAPEICDFLSREGTKLDEPTHRALLSVLDALRKQEFAASVGVSPLGVESRPVEIDTHYEARLIHKRRIARDEPFYFRLVLQKKFPEAPALTLHHFDAEWVWPRPEEDGGTKPQLRFLSDQVPSPTSTLADPVETHFHGRIPLREISRLFEAVPLESPSLVGRPPETIHLNLRFFAQTSGSDGSPFETGYRRTGFFPLQVENVSKPILSNDKGRYLAFLREDFPPQDPRLAQRARMDGYIPALCGPGDLLAALAAARNADSQVAILDQIAAIPAWPEAESLVLAGAIKGQAPFVRFLARTIPLDGAGFEREEIAAPDSWHRLSAKALKRVLTSDDPEDALAAARVLRRIRYRDRETSEQVARLLKTLEADPDRRGHFHALLAVSDRLLRPDEAGLLVSWLDRTERMAPASLPAFHPLLAIERPAHDLRVADAAAVAICRAFDRKAPGLLDPDHPGRFLPVESRDGAIRQLKAWWVKREKKT